MQEPVVQLKSETSVHPECGLYLHPPREPSQIVSPQCGAAETVGVKTTYDSDTTSENATNTRATTRAVVLFILSLTSSRKRDTLGHALNGGAKDEQSERMKAG